MQQHVKKKKRYKMEIMVKDITRSNEMQQGKKTM